MLSSPWVWGLALSVLVASAALWTMGIVKRGGLRKHVRDVRAFPAWLWVCGAVVVFAGAIVGGTLAATALGARGEGSRDIAVRTLGGQVVAIVVGIVLARMALSTGKKSGMGVQTGDLRRGLVAFAIIMPFVMATNLLSIMIYTRVYEKPPDAAAHALLRMYKADPKDPWVWALLGSAVFLGPIVEELIYRAFLQSGFLAAFKRAWLAILTTSILFTLAHLGGEENPNVPWHALPTLFVLSVGMGIGYERSGRLGVPILMHVLFNAVNVGMMLVMMRGK